MSKSKSHHKVIVIGSGPAGLTAALYAARANLKPLVMGGTAPGGQLMLTTEVENFPGFPEGIQGPDLMANIRKQAERFGATVHEEDVKSVDFSKRPFQIVTSKDSHTADSVVIATGASASWLGLPSEQSLIGRGVSSCATCDAAFFKDKKVAIVGGGDAAMEEAIFLTKFAKEVTVIHRRDTLRASQVMQERAKNNPKIDFIWNTVVEEVLGDERVTGVKLKNLENEKTSELELDGIFIAIGHKPNTIIFKGHIKLDQKGYIVPQDHMTHTSVPGVFVAGDVQDYRYRQAITAAGFGAMAALDAEKYLSNQD